MAPKLYEAEKPQKLDEEKEVNLWHERVGLAKKEQESWAEDSGAKRFVKQYKGEYGLSFMTRNKPVKIPPINEVFSYVQADIASVFNRDPYITVNAKAGTTKGAALWEAILNYWWRELKTKEELEYEIIDKDLIGYGWHKVGYATQSIGTGETLKIIGEKLYSKWLNWKDVVWNIGSKRPPVDCQWMAQRIVWPLQDIKDKYPKAKGMEGSPNPDIDEETYKKSAYKDDIKVGVMWEIWDAKEKKIRLIAENLKGKYLDEPKDWPDYLDEFPFQMYWDFAIPGSPRPMSSIAPWEAQILEEMIIMASAINHAKRWNRQAFVKSGTIDDNSLDKFERGDDGAIITYNGDTADVKFVDFGQLPTDFYLLMDRLQAIKRNINGQPEFARGGVTKTGTRTVGELQMMQAGNQSRQGRKIDRLETHCENIARHMMFHLKGNFDFEQTVKLTGDTPDEVIEALGENYDPTNRTVTFSPEDIEGEYDVDVKAGSTLPLDKQNRMQMLETILQTVAQVVSNAPMSNFLAALVGELLNDYDIKSLKEAYEMDVQAAEQQKQQEAQQQQPDEMKTMAEAAKRQAQSQQIQVDTQLSIEQMKLEALKDPKPHPSESISFKDLPPEGRIQLAAQAGIHLTPEAAHKLPPQPPKVGTNGSKR